MWQDVNFMSCENAHCPGWMASLICFRVVILSFVQVMYWFSSFNNKVAFPIFLGNQEGICKESLDPGPNSMVPSDSIEMTSEVIMLS